MKEESAEYYLERVAERTGMKRRPKKVSLNWNNVAVVLFIAFVLWQAGVFEPLYGVFKPKDVVQKKQEFNVLLPSGTAAINAETGELSMAFTNSVMDYATVETVRIKNLKDGRDCPASLSQPVSVNPGEFIAVNASGCAEKDAKRWGTFTIEVEIEGTTTKRSELYGRDLYNRRSAYGGDIPAERMNEMEKWRRESLENIEAGNTVVEYISRGTITGLYS